MADCVVCGEETNKHWINSVCSGTCQRERARRWRPEPSNPGLSTASSGARSELLVCADLLKRGYAVFRSVSPASPCDAIILKDNALLRVEITTGGIGKSGKLCHPSKDPELYDVLAVAVGSEIRYFPEDFRTPQLPQDETKAAG